MPQLTNSGKRSHLPSTHYTRGADDLVNRENREVHNRNVC